MQHSNLAKGLAMLGRGEDSMLVHMTPREVQSLQTLAMAQGGSLTINPHTGLPEAGFLSSLLPMIAGGLGTLLTGGAINPITLGLLTGVGTGLYTGDIKQGLFAGLGGFGGASLASGLAGLGGAAGAAKTAAAGAAGAGGISTAAGAGTGATALQAAGSAAPTIGTNFANFGKGAASLLDKGWGGFDPVGLGTGVLGTGGKAFGLSTAASAAPFLNTPMYTTGLPPEAMGMGDNQKDMVVPEYNLVDEGADPYDQQNFDIGGSRDWYKNQRFIRKAADGGIMSIAPSGFASGGLASFATGGRPGVAQPGGYLDGPGDGMSDSIPASISDKQPARLADGEFVVPADVVSHLGNGSSKAGAKQLYSLMDRVRQARTGTTEQGKQINPSKFLPA
jgi:hypothetical protein